MKRTEFKKLLREEIVRTLKKPQLNEARLNEMAQIAGELKSAIQAVIDANPELEGLALKKKIRSDEAVRAALAGDELYDNQLNRFIGVAKGNIVNQQRGRKPLEKSDDIATDTVANTMEMVKYVQAAKKAGKTIIGSKTNSDGTITIKYRKALEEVMEPLDEMAKIAGDLKANIERVIQANPELDGLALKKAIKTDPEIKAYFDEHPEEELYDNQLNKFIGLTKGTRELQKRGRKEAPEGETKTFASVQEFMKFLKTAEKSGAKVLSSDFKEDGSVDIRYTQEVAAINESKEERMVRQLIREELEAIMEEDDEKDFETHVLEMIEFDHEWDNFMKQNPSIKDIYNELINAFNSTEEWGELNNSQKNIIMKVAQDEFDKNSLDEAYEIYDDEGNVTSSLPDEIELDEEMGELDEMAKIAGGLKAAIEKVIQDNAELENLPLKEKIKADPAVTAALDGSTLYDNQLNQFIALTKGERTKGQPGKPAGTQNKPKTEKPEKPAGETRGAKKHSDKDKQYSFIKGAKSYTVDKTGGEESDNDKLKGVAEPTDYELRQMSRSGIEGEKEATLKDQQKRKMVNAFVARMRNAGILGAGNQVLDKEAYNTEWKKEQEMIKQKLASLKEETVQLDERVLRTKYLAGLITETEYRKGKQLL